VQAALAQQLDWPSTGQDSVLLFGLVISPLGSARPVEVIEGLLGAGLSGAEGSFGCEIVRTGLYAAAASGSVSAPPARGLVPTLTAVETC
jgi:hypothetical protein